jgi:hypothetical protein
MSSDDNEPASLTEEMGSEVTEEEPIDDLVNPLDTVSPQDVQTEYEETRPIVEQEDSTFIETAKVERMKPTPERARKAKRKRSSATESESKSLSKLHSELRKHSDARKKTDLAVKDIEKQLKALLRAHHSAIKDLKKQVTQMRTKLATIESKKSIAKKGARKTTSKKSKRTTKKIIRKR